MRRKNNLKLPNGFGSIVYLGANRRKPYGALKTFGWDENRKQIKKYIGYGESWNDAYQLLLDYNKVPYNLDYKGIKFKDVYANVLTLLTEKCKNQKISDQSFKCYKSAYNQNLNKLDDKKFIEITRKDVQAIIDNCGLGYTSRNYIKILFSLMVDYSNEELKLNIDKDIYKKIDLGSKEKSLKHKVLKIEDIAIIRENAKSNDLAKMIMIYLYTGMRPSELLRIENKKVFLDEDYMIGGIKTEAGKDRIIPIHSEIKKYVEYFYDSSNKYLIINRNTGGIMTYSVLEKEFKKLMENLSMNYIPHDPRHSFATKCAELKIPDPIIKRIMGHSMANDVTNDVYIHLSKDVLKEYIERINY